MRLKFYRKVNLPLDPWKISLWKHQVRMSRLMFAGQGQAGGSQTKVLLEEARLLFWSFCVQYPGCMGTPALHPAHCPCCLWMNLLLQTLTNLFLHFSGCTLPCITEYFSPLLKSSQELDKICHTQAQLQSWFSNALLEKPVIQSHFSASFCYSSANFSLPAS